MPVNPNTNEVIKIEDISSAFQDMRPDLKLVGGSENTLIIASPESHIVQENVEISISEMGFTKLEYQGVRFLESVTPEAVVTRVTRLHNTTEINARFSARGL
jgi:hypothetical protein